MESLFQQWKAVHDPLFAGERKPVRLVRLHCTLVADGVPCSLDGDRWGVLRTRAGRRGRSGQVPPVREFVLDRSAANLPDRRDVVGAGFDPEHVFITEDVYDMIAGIRAEKSDD